MKRLVNHTRYCSKRKYILVALSLLVFCGTYARDKAPAVEDNDSTAVYLQEFVVESKNAWIEKDRAVFVPTRREKNRANSPATLISSMSNPLMTVDSDGNIKNLRGENVTIFINGIEAQDMDISTFWPSDVIRVEYYSDPTDPKFKGNPSVVNFIVPVYVAGGVTKAGTYQCVSPYSGSYDVASKLVYKKMTYGANVYGHYGNFHETQDENTTYRDIWYNGKKYDRIENNAVSSVKQRLANVNAAFNAIYKTGKVHLDHTAGLSWSESPVFSNVEGTGIWMPNLFGSSVYWSKSSGHSLSPWMRGFYIFTFHPKWRMEATWKYSYASAGEESSNKTGDAPIISNANDEKTHTLYADANISYRLRDNLSIYITSKNKVTFYNIDYTGSYNNNYTQVFGDYYINPGVTWNPKSGLTFTLIPALSISQRKIQDEKTSTALNPNVYFSTNWYQTSKSYLNFWYQLSTNQVQASHANDVVQRESELVWFMGTLDLLSYNTMNLGLQQTWMCKPWFTPTLVLQYNNVNHSYYRQYDAAPEDMGGLIHHYVDCGPQNTLMLGAQFQFNLFNRRLNFYVQPLWKMDQFTDKQQPFTSHRMLLYGNVVYNFGNFSVYAYYRCATKSYYNRGMYYEYWPDNWNAGISYGNGNLYASLEVDNIFRTTNNQNVIFLFDNYHSTQNYGHKGRTFSLNLSYTFGYGKRVSHDIDIDNSSNFQSGAAGH